MFDALFPSLVSMVLATEKKCTSFSVVRDIPDSNETQQHTGVIFYNKEILV